MSGLPLTRRSIGVSARNSLRLALALLCALPLTTPRALHACVMRDDVPSSEYEQFSEQYHGQALWIKYTMPDGNRSYCSAYRLNDMWAITAAHCLERGMVPVTDISAGTSANFNTPELGEVRQIVRVVVHPRYNTNYVNDPIAVDLALLQFDRPLLGPVVRFGSLAVGGTIRSIGYGYPALASGPLQSDGKRRAYQMETRSIAPSSLPYKYLLSFQPTWRAPLPFEGAATGGHSGSGVLNTQGELVGVMSTATPPGTRVTCSATRLDLFKDWIETIITPQLTMTPVPNAHRLTWDASATGWELQSSPDLSTWTPLVPALSGAGTHDDPIADRPRRYYRLAKP